MKLFIAVSCFLAVASASHLGFAAYSNPAWIHAQHNPVIGVNGVPLDEPAVAVAKAHHAAAHVDAHARNGDFHHVVAPYTTYAGHVAAPVAYAGHYAHYAGPQHLPVIGANGVPVDEPAVSAARAHHAASYVEAQVRNGDVAVAHYGAPVATYAAHIAAPAVPLDTPEVAAAKAAHFAAHAEASVRNGAYHHYAPLIHYRKRRSASHAYAVAPVAFAHYAGAQHIPVIGANGVPVDEPAVAIAKAEHAAAHVDAAVRNGDYAVGHVAQIAHVAAPITSYAAHYAAPITSYAAHIAAPVAHYAGPQHLPVIGANGVPVDEPAVSAARAHHAAAHIEAHARNGDATFIASPVAYAAGHVAYAAPVVHHAGVQHLPVIGANGVPHDEPAVAVAKAHHAAAHVEAHARNGDYHHVVAPVVHTW